MLGDQEPWTLPESEHLNGQNESPQLHGLDSHTEICVPSKNSAWEANGPLSSDTCLPTGRLHAGLRSESVPVVQHPVSGLSPGIQVPQRHSTPRHTLKAAYTQEMVMW